jgi:hypothetical protein
MQYMILIYEAESDFAKRADPAQAEAYWGAWTAYGAALAQAGVIVGGAGLQPHATATTLRIAEGRRRVQDGPYADTKEQLGGYFVVEVPDLDAALDWAARCPAAPTGAVEVRPLVPMPPRG